MKLNQDSIRLKTVEIGRDFISLSYGTDKWTEHTRLLHGAIKSDELAGMVEKFRYETGIVPVVTD